MAWGEIHSGPRPGGGVHKNQDACLTLPRKQCYRSARHCEQHDDAERHPGLR